MHSSDLLDSWPVEQMVECKPLYFRSKFLRYFWEAVFMVEGEFMCEFHFVIAPFLECFENRKSQNCVHLRKIYFENLPKCFNIFVKGFLQVQPNKITPKMITLFFKHFSRTFPVIPTLLNDNNLLIRNRSAILKTALCDLADNFIEFQIELDCSFKHIVTYYCNGPYV